MMYLRGLVLGSILLVVTTASFPQSDEISKRLGIPITSGLSDSKVASGLKEALRVGADNTVAGAMVTSATKLS